MKKILVTGCDGQLGTCLRRTFEQDPDIEAVYTDYKDLDITDEAAVNRHMGEGGYDVVVNCAAFTAVDKAETEAVRASMLNTAAVGFLGKAASANGAKMIHISTDYVFSGQNFRPYEENDEPYPQGIYGRTKLEGEGLLTSFCRDAMIIRTAWLYSEFGKNFVKTMLSLAESRPEINVVADQIGTPTYAGDLADAIHAIISQDTWKPGIYHYTNEGVASWYDFTRAIMDLTGNTVKVNPIPTSAYPTPARRPLYSVLSKAKIKNTFGIGIPYWRDSLKTCLKRMGQTN